MDGKLPEISVLDSKCLMAGEFGILFTQAAILTPRNGYAVRALNLGLNPEASRALGQFQPEQANRAWVGDITYVRTASGWLYLAVILDLFSRKVVGWAMAPHMQASLVCDALRMAIGARQPQPGLLMHTDRGSQYASQAHTELLGAHGLEQSMSRKGNCWDNAVCERFFLSLKMERVWQGQYANHGEAQRDIADYIVNFYNAQRLHSTLGYVPPNEFEQLGTTTFPQIH